MSGTSILITLLGGVALLLLGVKMVRSGVTKAYGVKLRQMIELGTANRFKGWLSGIAASTLIQSSTATALILTSFASKGAISVAAALSVILGADLGTTLIAQVLSFDIAWLGPLFVFVGVVGQIGLSKQRRYYVCRSLIGLGLMLLALDLIMGAMGPLSKNTLMADILSAISQDWPVLFFVVMALTALAHSSLAIVLLIMALATGGALTIHAAFVAVLAANVGGAIPPLVLNISSSRHGRMTAYGMFSMRLFGAVIALALIPFYDPLAEHIGNSPNRQVVNFHTLFNLSRGLLLLPFTVMIAKLLSKCVAKPVEPGEGDPGQTIYLERSALEYPSVALPQAKREILRMADHLQSMLSQSVSLFYGENRHLLDVLPRQEDDVDRLYEAIKHYLLKLSESEMDEAQSTACQEGLIFLTNLEHIGDVIDKNLCEIGAKRLREGVELSSDGLEEVIKIHGEVMQNFRLGTTLFMSGEVDLARELVESKERLQKYIETSSTAHFNRLREGVDKTVQTSTLHLDILRDFRRINDYITHIAYGILERHGTLQPRLKRDITRELKQTIEDSI